jgi:hypothetical protein
MKANAKSHTHLQFARANAQTKNCKRVCLANAQEKIKFIANLGEKIMEINERQPLTMHKRNAGQHPENKDYSKKTSSRFQQKSNVKT